MEKISVITPVYNADLYLEECIDSVRKQIYSDLEIILIDDGSKDCSGLLSDSAASIDDRIIVIHKKNKGSAAARNNGLDCATSKLISFVDADDVASVSFLDYLHTAMIESGSDIAICGYAQEYSELDDRKTEQANIYILSCKEACREYIDEERVNQLLWNKLFKSKTIVNVRFPEGKVIDDEYFTYKAILNAQRIACISNKLYYYRQNPNSIMHSNYSIPKAIDGLVAIIERNRLLVDRFPQLEKPIQKAYLYSCMYNGQKSMRELGMVKSHYIINKMQIPISGFKHWEKILNSEKGTHRVWCRMAIKSLYLTCAVRNVLKIGL